MESNREPFDQWAIVEVMGHSIYAGRVTEQVLAGGALVRIDVPEVDGQPAITKLVGTGAIFAITPCSEEVARRAAARLCNRPVSIVGLLPPPAVERGHDDLVDDEDDLDDGEY